MYNLANKKGRCVMIQYQETRKLTKRQKICKAIEGYEICWNMNNSDLQSIANRISNDIDVESNLIFDFLIEKRRESRAERQMEIDRIVREVHNEYGAHSLRWGKHKELTVICERLGVDMKTAKTLLNNFGMSQKQWEEMGLWKKTEEEKEQEAQQQFEKQRQRLAKEQEKVYRNMAKCPRCGSTSLSYDTKKLSIGRALVGDAIAGAPGAVLGGLSSKKGYAVCLNCGKKWKV